MLNILTMVDQICHKSINEKRLKSFSTSFTDGLQNVYEAKNILLGQNSVYAKAQCIPPEGSDFSQTSLTICLV